MRAAEESNLERSGLESDLRTQSATHDCTAPGVVTEGGAGFADGGATPFVHRRLGAPSPLRTLRVRRDYESPRISERERGAQS
ncbi:hypothetical protein GCM10028799_57180 [Kribbella italica]